MAIFSRYRASFWMPQHLLRLCGTRSRASWRVRSVAPQRRCLSRPTAFYTLWWGACAFWER